ncbi:MAG: hypothetical protein ACE5OP_14020 [Candidatus Glassbacteria bacterium]
MEKESKQKVDVWAMIRDELKERGIELESLCCGAGDLSEMKMVCVAPNLKTSVQEIGKATRDQVVMVRIDEETSKALDAWVETGAVKSRSEAAALFINEGLKIRSSELEKLKDALKDVDEAKKRLREKARDIFGEK